MTRLSGLLTTSSSFTTLTTNPEQVFALSETLPSVVTQDKNATTRSSSCSKKQPYRASEALA